MFKPLSIAALAALASLPAFAQSSVTMYGRFNVTLERQKVSDGDATSTEANNASRIGVKGTEDLGSGLKAGFQLEHGFNVDTGAQTNPTYFWNRQSEVWLGNPYATLRLGRFTSEAYFATADYVSMHNHDTGTSEDKLYSYIGRDRDKIGFMGTPMPGLTLHASVALREATDGSDKTKIVDLATQYDVGNLHLGAGFERAGSFSNQFGLRALYEMGAFTFGGYYQRDKNGALDCIDTHACGSRNNFRVSGMYAVGASEFHLNVGHAGSYSDVDESSATQMTVAYNYNLSKRTKVYTYYTRVNNSSAAFYGPVNGAGEDFSSFALGIRHNF